MKKGLSILLVLCTIMCTHLTGCGKPSVNLNDYVVITDEGYDGYGKISAMLDYEKLIEDHQDELTDKNIDTSLLGVKTPELAASFVFEAHKPYELSYEMSENLKNGDNVEFTWETNESAIETLKRILEVNIKYDKFTYTVKDLKALTEVDPFENIEYNIWGVSGAGRLYNNPQAIVKTKDVTTNWELKFDTSKNGKISNGDTINLSLNDPYDDAYYASTYGVKLTRKSADITITDLKYYPTENPKEVFEYLRESDINNAKTAIIDHYSYWAKIFSYCQIGTINVEYVGAAYYYNDTIDFTNSNYDQNNRLVLAFHITNDIVPNGWYAYAAPIKSVYIRQEKQEDGSLSKITTLGTNDGQLDDFSPYDADYAIQGLEYFNKSDIPEDFTYNDKRYSGNLTLDECMKAFEYHAVTKKGNIQNPYNHMIATEELQSAVNEY